MLAVSSFWRVAVPIAAIPVQSQYLPVRVVYCLFLLHLSSGKCEGLKCNFNTFLIVQLRLLLAFLCTQLSVLQHREPHEKYRSANLLPWESFNMGFFSFREVLVSRHEAVRNPVIP